MPDKVCSGLSASIITGLRIGVACTSHCPVYGSAKNTNGEINDDKEKDKKYNRSSYAF